VLYQLVETPNLGKERTERYGEAARKQPNPRHAGNITAPRAYQTVVNSQRENGRPHDDCSDADNYKEAGRKRERSKIVEIVVAL
jgi:hypothetical protein